MKELFFLFALLLFSGCCALTSADCFCDPPSPELSQEALDWITPFNDVEFFVYEDDFGILDTLQTERVQAEEWVGGDECGSLGDVERAVLMSNNNRLISIEATRKDNVGFNDPDENESYLTGYLKVNEDELIVFNEQASGAVIDNFDWNGMLTTVIEVICEDNLECNNLIMRSFTISREFGLIKFTDSNGKNWKLIN